MSKSKVHALWMLAFLLVTPIAAAAQGMESYGAYSSNKFAGGVYTDAICDLIGLMGGGLGALLTGTAIATGLIAAAVGGFNSIKAAIIVGISSFALTALVSIFFGTFNCAA